MEHRALRIVFEDADCMVLEKPAGMVVHPAYRHPDHTFWDDLVPIFQARGLGDRPHLLHRLDRDTSGLLCVPKHAAARRTLGRALERGRFTKHYLALVHGPVSGPLVLDAPLDRDPLDRRRVIVTATGKPARTLVSVLRRLPAFTLLRVRLETGRTHQIRAHLCAIGAPLAGDVVYGPQPAALARLFLHADLLSFPHPVTGEPITCRSPLPLELRRALHDLAHFKSGPDPCELADLAGGIGNETAGSGPITAESDCRITGCAVLQSDRHAGP